MVALRSFLQDKQIKQSILLLSTSVIVMILVLGINFFITKILGKVAYGNYSLVINIFNFCQIIFNFGFFYSISRVIALSDSLSKQRELYAVGLILTFFLFALFSICLFIYINTFNEFNNEVVFKSILFCIPFGWVFLLNNFNELLLQGSNKIILLSFSRVMPKINLFLSLVFIFYLTNTKTSINLILFCYLISSFLPYFYIIYRLNPRFSNLSKRFKEIKEANMKFGFNIYIGSVFAVGASSLSGILIGYFGVNIIEVGYYFIALQLSAPLSLIPNVLATASFKKFATSKSIDRKLLIIMYSISIVSLIVIFIIAGPVVLKIHGAEYIESVNLLYLLAIGSVLYGIADFYNRFLLANGKGTELRNVSFFVGGILIISNIVLIKSYGAAGASIATIISGLSYLIFIIYYIKKLSIAP